jgi:NADH:ubiquinone oxidoreductase subunit 4 (subunit M)
MYGLEHGGDWKAGGLFGLVTLGLFGTGDVGMLCILFELLNLPLLSMLWFRSVSGVKGVLYATVLLVVYGLVSGMFLLIGVSYGIGWLIGGAAGVKLALAPLHVWLGKVHVECSTLGSVLLAGVALKVGYYVGVLYAGEIWSYVSASTFFFLVGMGLVQLGLLDAVDTKRLVALFSVAHMQVLMVFLGVTGFSSLLTTWVTVGMMAHSLVSSGLFFLVGRLVEYFGSRNLSELSIWNSSLPFLWWFLLGSNCALPISSLFLVEILGHASLLSFGSLWVVVLLLILSSLSFLATVIVLGRLAVGSSFFLGSVFGTVASFALSVCSFTSWLLWCLVFP